MQGLLRNILTNIIKNEDLTFVASKINQSFLFCTKELHHVVARHPKMHNIWERMHWITAQNVHGSMDVMRYILSLPAKALSAPAPAIHEF